MITYWVTMADNWGKWVNSEPQMLPVAVCDVAALDATSVAAATAALTATAQAGFGSGNNPTRFAASDLEIITPYQTSVDITLGAINGTPPYTFTLNTQPANGTVDVIDANNVRYTPNGGFIGDDTFTFLAADSNGFTDIGIVRVGVGTSSLIAEGQTVNVPYNASNYAITLRARGGVTPYNLVTVVSQPTVGSLTPSGSDMFVFNYTPPMGFLGSTTFVWSVTDSAPAYDEGTVTINVVPGTPSTSRVVSAADDAAPGFNDIYVMNADGSSRTNLTNDPASNDNEPVWSPDGTKIAFSSNRSGNYEIYVMNADGSGVTNLSNHASNDTQPTWSPDGNTIAFVTDRDGGDTELFRVPALGGASTRLTNNAIDDFSPDYAPNGTQIAYHSGAAGAYDIYVIAADGSGTPTQITSDPLSDIEPAWGPNGNYIAYASQQGGSNLRIFRILADGSGSPEQLTFPPTGTDDRAPVWAPDGSELLFSRATSSGTTLVRIWYNGQTSTPLGVPGRDPVWRP
jgi:Tol biopolymer transport system component